LSEDGFFYPSPASPVIDTGDPNAIYKDQDGSRNDMGIYGGPHAPGVRMKLTPASANVNNGDSISMTLTIENVGDLAQNMMITVTLPSQTISPTIAATGVISDSNIYFSLGDVFRTETVTFTVTADIEQPDVLLFSYSATYQKAERVQQQEGTVNVIVNALQSFLPVVTR
ncbi:MAG: hypothetical protein GY805_03100, partial [Chloroflexi bacterium]|nr:hypothetical protein [Chloroflexota bacterium]